MKDGDGGGVVAEESELKMWLVVRGDIQIGFDPTPVGLAMSLGKYGAQVGHAFGRLYTQSITEKPEVHRAYLETNEPKVTVKVKNEAALIRVEEEARALGIPCQLIRDAGRSELPPNTATVCAFGPARREEIGGYLKRLQLLTEKPPVTPP
jgi:PTH2 family peptidyl-tRNA hydrolase